MVGVGATTLTDFSHLSQESRGEFRHTHKVKVIPTNTHFRWVSAHLQSRTHGRFLPPTAKSYKGCTPFRFTLILYHKPQGLSSVFQKFFYFFLFFLSRVADILFLFL